MNQKLDDFFKQEGLENCIQEFEQPSATSEQAANEIGCTIEHIAKSITFKIEERTILIVAAGNAKIDNPKYKEKFCKKAIMLSREEVEERTSYPVGGVCPFLLPANVEVYFDKSIQHFEKMYFACGTPNSIIGLTIEEAEKLAKPKEWIDVCKE